MAAVGDDLWREIHACTKCLVDPQLKVKLSHERYLPFPTVGVLPPGVQRVACVLVGREPFDRWVKKAGSRDEANRRIDAGRRNFAGGRDESCLQYGIERWLLPPGEGYYFTDIGKCKIRIADADATRANATKSASRQMVDTNIFARDAAADVSVAR